MEHFVSADQVIFYFLLFSFTLGDLFEEFVFEFLFGVDDFVCECFEGVDSVGGVGLGVVEDVL